MARGAERIDTEREALEDWFVDRGLPNLIHDYGATTDVFTRAAPLLVVLWLFGIVGAYGDRFQGWNQAFAALAGFALFSVVAVGVNRLRGRRPLQMPDRVGGLELAAFVLAPAVLPILLDNSSWGTFITAILSGLITLGFVWFAYGFGLAHIAGWALRNLFHQLGDVFSLMIRSLPLLLVFTMFLFLNAELWQVADDFTWPLFWLSSGGLVAVAVAFVLIRIPTELHNIAEFPDDNTFRQLVARSGAPIAVSAERAASRYALSRTDRLNIAILATFAVGVQVLLVMLIIGAFYMLFGLVTVRTNTIGQWTLGGVDSVETWIEFSAYGAPVSLTAELVKVAGFLMAFTALQFTVSALTDATYKQEFFDDLTGEIREALAVRVAYLQDLDVPPSPPREDS